MDKPRQTILCLREIRLVISAPQSSQVRPAKPTHAVARAGETVEPSRLVP